MRPELRSRFIFGISLSLIFIGGVTHDIMRGSHLGVLLLGMLGIIFASREMVKLTRSHAPHVQYAPMIVISMALVAVANWQQPISLPFQQLDGNPIQLRPESFPAVMLIITIGMMWIVLSQMFRHATEHFITSVGATLLGIIYLGGSLHMLEQLALIETSESAYRGTQLLLLFIATTKLGDVCAYFGGRALGKNKMSPRISPGKTWEGFACSFIGSIGGAYLFAWSLSAICDHAPFNGWWQPAVWGLILGPLGVLGDLAESAIKRDAAVKDSGASIPGFGGVLDILDAIVFGAPIAYLLALLLP